MHQFKIDYLIINPKLSISGDGNFLIRLGLHRFAHPHRWLQEDEIIINTTTPAIINLDFWDKIEIGHLYIWVEALSDGRINNFSLVTNDYSKLTVSKTLPQKLIDPKIMKENIIASSSNIPDTVLQQIVLPSLEFSAPEEMYVRCWNDEVSLRYSSQKLIFRRGGKVSFDTFFNSITVDSWKEKCKVDDLFLLLRGKGEFILRFGLHRLGHPHRWLNEEKINLDSEISKELNIEIGAWNILEKGLLYFAIESLGDGEIESGFFYTNTKKSNDIKLGIVITHFNRKQYVLPAINRIKTNITNTSLYKNKVQLIVVDNSKNITEEEAKDITLIPNENLGGSGGFTRGLLYLKDNNFTHCLFMDDDASCEIESIRRAVALLEYTKDSSLAIAGSLLRELEPYRLLEKGAKFDTYCHLLKHGLDMRHVHDLLVAERNDEIPDYGAWWFFAYPIEHIKAHPFPFFVRGDDILFGRMNNFDIITMNGVSCWGEDFELKSGPLTRYLDTRNHLMQNLYNPKSGLLKTIKLITQFFSTALFSYNYASAQAARLAVEHVMKGSKFWSENIDMASIRNHINSFSESEKLKPVKDLNIKKLVHFSSPDKKIRKIIRLLTLNSFLIPSFFLKKRTIYHPKGFRGVLRNIFGFENIFYIYEPLQLGYIAKHDKKLFFREIFCFVKTIALFSIEYKSLVREYNSNAFKNFTTNNFWTSIYKKPCLLK